MFCREQAAHYEAQKDAFAELGVGLAAIGNGTAPMAAEFVAQFGITFDVFTDPGRRVYQAADMTFAVGMKFATLKYGFRALRNGYLQGRTKGHPNQQGGVLLVDTAAEVRFAFRETGPGEHMAAAEVLETVRALGL